MDFKDKRLMMTEEDARNRAKELLNENQVDLLTKYMFLEQQCKKQKEVIDKAIEKLYCWGETLDSIFQKEMLDILEEGKNE